jgi:hypothetical protein
LTIYFGDRNLIVGQIEISQAFALLGRRTASWQNMVVFVGIWKVVLLLPRVITALRMFQDIFFIKEHIFKIAVNKHL